MRGVTDLDEQACWLARVLHARDVPVERLAHNLRLAGEVACAHVGGDEGEALDEVLRRAALAVSALALAGIERHFSEDRASDGWPTAIGCRE